MDEGGARARQPPPKAPEGFQRGGVQSDLSRGAAIALEEGDAGTKRPRRAADADTGAAPARAPMTARGRRVDASNIGFGLLAKAGWKEGTGVGRRPGAVEPLGVEANRGTRGLGADGRPVLQAAAAAAAGGTAAQAAAASAASAGEARQQPLQEDLRRVLEHARAQERRDARQRDEAAQARAGAAQQEAGRGRAAAALRRAFDAPEPLPGGGNPLLRGAGGAVARGGLTGANPLLTRLDGDDDEAFF